MIRSSTIIIEKRNRFKPLLLTFFLVVGFLKFTSENNAQVNTHRDIGICLGKILKFTEWPDNAFMVKSPETLNFGYYGDDQAEFIKLKQTISSMNVSNKSTNFYKLEGIEESKECQVLFISATKEDELESILEYTLSFPILTVSSTDNFAQKGVILNFNSSTSKTPFEINITSLQKSGLYIDSILLTSVKTVN